MQHQHSLTTMPAPTPPSPCLDPAPASRREARRNHRREAILDAAEASFMAHGYAGTAMSAIAAALGGSKATLWRYFRCKEVLFAAVIDRAAQAFREQLALALDPREPVSIALTRFAREFLRKLTSAQGIALHRLVVSEARRFPETGRIFSARAIERTRRLLADYLGEAMARGALRVAEPSEAARYLTGLCMAGSHHALLLGLIEDVSAEVIAEEAERVVAVFLRAYASR